MRIFKGYLLIACACLMLLTASVYGQHVNYDGQWWLSTGQRQRGGFIDGFTLCYSHFVGGEIFHEGIRAYEARVTKYLRDHPKSSRETVEAILIKVASPPYAKTLHRPSQSNETSEELAAKWGAHNDGNDWSGTDLWDLGYIQGFLECYSRHSKHEYGTFSKPAEWYVKAISDWYGMKADDPDAINPSRQDEKIPEVLFRFRDKPAGR